MTDKEERRKVLKIALLGSAALFLVFAALLFTRALPLDTLDADIAGFHQQDVLGALCVVGAAFDLVVLQVMLRRL